MVPRPLGGRVVGHGVGDAAAHQVGFGVVQDAACAVLMAPIIG